jgi:hypothetical protein
MTDKPRTKIASVLYELAEEKHNAGEIGVAYQLKRAGAHVDFTALVMNKKGAEIKNLGAYREALELYRFVTGEDYNTKHDPKRYDKRPTI